ncbi:probable U3 small nucleolar RNA-associated protein 11 [Paramacrobiotus metropolitanus]|uniref:probable U3 small nucleolar RNA-associated protein 11 n=1 Tax=Paramacrobiotus metropolitanus TaxID=2943436 RepID=UPI0024457800|nr:probable U3 small nucleolar RNA-associated protein 11 [Paramacrobiotus metropolitanus]
MSSWTRTSKAQQRIHKERAQPESRRKLGFLEKKKDYKIRAIDHEKKDRTIRSLRQKALDKNPDEFYFHMHNSKLVDGKHIEKEKEEEATDAQKMLMKSQDLAYVRSKRISEMKKIEALKASLAGTFIGGNTKHTFFVDSEGDKNVVKERLSRSHIAEEADNSVELTADPLIGKERKKLLKELRLRVDREKELRTTEEKLQTRRNLLEKRKPVKIKEGTKDSPAVYKWTFQRKR